MMTRRPLSRRVSVNFTGGILAAGPAEKARADRKRPAILISFIENSETIFRLSDLFDRLLEIGQQIAPVFDADRNAYQAVADMSQLHLFGRHAGMRGGLGMASQRLDAAQRHGVAHDLEMAEKRERGVAPAVEIDGKDTARKIALRETNANLFTVVEKRRIVNMADLRFADQSLGNALGVLALAVHAQRNRGQTAV